MQSSEIRSIKMPDQFCLQLAESLADTIICYTQNVIRLTNSILQQVSVE